MKNKKILTISIIIIVTILIIIFIKNNYIFSKKGNNITNKSADEIKEYILNIESYKAVANVIIKSNKNQNNYILLQEYNENTKKYIQEVIEPKNIEGVKFIYDGKNLKLENTKLSLNKIYSEYKYIDSNELSLISFIEDFKENKNSRCFEENNMVLLETEIENSNKKFLN